MPKQYRPGLIDASRVVMIYKGHALNHRMPGSTCGPGHTSNPRISSAAPANIAHMFGAGIYRSNDCLHGSGEVLVFPQPDNAPASSFQGGVDNPIALHVPAKLRRPVPLVRCRMASVDGTNMPEAAIHEDRDLPSREDDVWPDLHFPQVKAKILPVPIAEPMQCAPEHHFRLGVRSPVRLHVARPALVQRRGVEPALVSLFAGSKSLGVRHIHTGKRTRRCLLIKDTAGRLTTQRPGNERGPRDRTPRH